jgi:hypothetical protein
MEQKQHNITEAESTTHLQFREYGLGGAQASRNIKMSDENDNAFTI